MPSNNGRWCIRALDRRSVCVYKSGTPHPDPLPLRHTRQPTASSLNQGIRIHHPPSTARDTESQRKTLSPMRRASKEEKKMFCDFFRSRGAGPRKSQNTSLGDISGERGDGTTNKTSPTPLYLPSRRVAGIMATVFPWAKFPQHWLFSAFSVSPCLKPGTPGGW